MKVTRKGQRGFTLVETIIVIVVLVILAAIAFPAVSGFVASTRTQGKESDIRKVESGVQRYFAEHENALPISGSASPTSSLTDVDGDGILKVKVNTIADDPPGFPADGAVDMVCGDGSGTMQAALAQCFGALDFAGKLAPDYVKESPKHAADAVTATADGDGATADLSVTGGDSAGARVELYLDASIAITDGLKVWNVDKAARVIILKGDADYGKA
jgi:prepilin-type N-terminal cleavage/methylation domain-containing protein